jgi:hypothetical protein
MSEEKIDFSSLEAIVLGPEDTLILRMPYAVSQEDADRIRRKLPHLRVLLLSKEVDVVILRREDEP